MLVGQSDPLVPDIVTITGNTLIRMCRLALNQACSYEISLSCIGLQVYAIFYYYFSFLGKRKSYESSISFVTC